MALTLNVLCQSPINQGRQPTDAIRETVALAKTVDELGYHRFWVAEHHSDRALASGSPAVLMAHIAAQTQQIRVGSGGVLLPHHAPLKVAEDFNLLAALHPGRIDLGVGRSGGSEGRAPQALRSQVGTGKAWPLFDELLSWLGEGTAARPFAEVFASPPVPTPAQVWALGTSAESAQYAGERGLPYSFGAFLDPRNLMPALTAYHGTFKPSKWSDKAKVNLGWYVCAADTEEEAWQRCKSSELWFVETFLRGQNKPFPTTAEAEAAQYSPQEKMMIEFRRQTSLVGTGEQVVAGLKQLQSQLMVDEFTLVTLTHDPAHRHTSYACIAAANH